LAEIRLSKIDASNRGDHYHVTKADECYYLFEYTSQRDYRFGPANDLISNLKKSVSRVAMPEYWHKGRVIADCSRYLASTLNDDWLRVATLVPVPPSKDRSNPLYDNRITVICCNISAYKNYPIDVRELVEQRESTHAAHESPQDRPSLEQLRRIYRIDESLVDPAPAAIGIVDDVLTAGTHFRAMKDLLAVRFPSVRSAGIFIARRVFPDETANEFFPVPDV
jgi:hypothetical protein